MATNDYFSKFKEEGSGQNVPRTRRVGHSISNRFRAAGAGAAGETLAFAGGQLNAWGTVSGAAALAAAASATATGVLGVAAIFQLVNGAYSNRSAAHRKLTPHVWSFIDDEPPKSMAGQTNEIGAAAYRLIIDGQSQMTILETKLKKREKDFVTFLGKLSGPTMTRAEKVKAYEKAEKSGEVFEYMRRLNHYANYLQAFTVVTKAMQRDLTPLPDIGLMVQSVASTRTGLKRIAKNLHLLMDETTSNPGFDAPGAA